MFSPISKGLLSIGVIVFCWAGNAQADDVSIMQCGTSKAAVCDVSFSLVPTFAPMCEATLQTRIFAIQNNTPVTMPIKYIRVLNANGSQNAQATIGIAPINNCGTALASGASCNIAVNVLPTSAETFNLVLDVGVASSQGNLTTAFSLSSFAGCNVGFNLPLPVYTDKCSTGSESQIFTITNNALTSLPIGLIQVQPQVTTNTFLPLLTFGTPVNQCITTASLGIGASCNIEVIVPPGGAGTTVDQLLLVDINNVTLAAPINLEVVPTCDFIFTNLPTPFNMACDITQQLIYTVKNNTLSAGAATINSLSGSGAPPLPLSAATINPFGNPGSLTTCDISNLVAAGDSCTIEVDLFEACSGGVSGTFDRILNVDTPNLPSPGTIAAPAITTTITVPPPGPPTPANYLGDASACAILAGTAITNVGALTTVTNGDVCLSPGTSVTAFPPGVITSPGTLEVNTSIANNAQAALASAMSTFIGFPCTATSPADLGGQTLLPGVYCSPSTTAGLTGTLILNGGVNDIFVFKIGTGLTTASSSQVLLIGGVKPANVYWVVGSAAVLGTSTQFQGNILAGTSITMNNLSNLVNGRALAQAAVSLTGTSLITAPP